MVLVKLDSGQLIVEGVPGDVIEAYGMLLMAYEAIMRARVERDSKKQAAGLTVPRMLLPPGVG